jgi:hypothetical protein
VTGLRGTAVALALCALAAAGCGLGEGESRGEVELTVTRDYGGGLLSRETHEASESDTVLRLLDRQAELETRYGGGFVQSIDGLSGTSDQGRRVDWFFYVNGIESPVGSADYRPGEGDRIWWDYRDWTNAMRVPAVVGSYPEPFLHGFRGERWSTEVRCLTQLRACRLVSDRLAGEGVTAPVRRGLGASDGAAIRVLVGPWRAIDDDSDAVLLRSEPSSSGVFARFDGNRLALLDESGAAARRVRGAGLIAAVRPGEGPPTWVVTGTDPASVATGAAPLFDQSLRDRYAIAITGEQGVIPLPLGAGR